MAERLLQHLDEQDKIAVQRGQRAEQAAQGSKLMRSDLQAARVFTQRLNSQLESC